MLLYKKKKKELSIVFEYYLQEIKNMPLIYIWEIILRNFC